MRIFVFLLVFTLITGLISYYIFIRGLQSIPQGSSLRSPYTIVFWFVVFSFIGGRLLENRVPWFLSDLLIWAGSFWMAAILYFLLAVIALDLIRLANYFFHFYPAFVAAHYPEVKYILSASIIGVVGITLLAGHINSILPRVARYEFRIPRKASKLEALNIVAVSDVHLGTIVGRSRFDRIVDKINDLEPDLILLPGDIVDEDLAPVIRQNLGESLRKLRSRYGVFGITGNHEYIGGVKEACDYLVGHDIQMLRDQTIKIADSFFLVGREDRSSTWRGGKPRKSLDELMQSVDRDYPVILMDHQPFGLDEAASQRIDLQISGHTHNGQLWPLNYIVKRIYELPWGYMEKSGTRYYVSCGVGTWGPPIRIGNRPEIMNFRIQFN